jgi:hypothetical protein
MFDVAGVTASSPAVVGSIAPGGVLASRSVVEKGDARGWRR